MSIIRLIIAFFLCFSQLITPYFQFLFNGGVKNFFEDWSAEQVFTRDYAVELEKEPGKDFVVLNFTDIQLTDDTIFSEDGEKTEAVIKEQIEKVKPDLITLTGDNCSSDVGYIHWAEYIDSFDIPWAPVMGNHDGDNGKKLKEAWDGYTVSSYENCLYKFGPKDMGNGNYIINITENDKIIHTLFMVDTHSSSEDTEAGAVNYGPNGEKGYDHLWANQIEWYKWAVNGIKNIAGKTVESTVFFHIPCYEYRTAQSLMCDVQTIDGGTRYVPKAEYADTCFGSNDEGICSPEGNNGFFQTCLDLGSTTRMVAGHDHKNTLCLLYKGIHLDYGLKSGYGSYWQSDKIGGSVMKINSDGHTTYSHSYTELY